MSDAEKMIFLQMSSLQSLPLYKLRLKIARSTSKILSSPLLIKLSSTRLFSTANLLPPGLILFSKRMASILKKFNTEQSFQDAGLSFRIGSHFFSKFLQFAPPLFPLLTL